MTPIIPFIPFLIVTILLITQIKMFNNLCMYLSSTYPEEWQKLSPKALGTPSRAVAKTYLVESLKSGYFSTLDDPKITKFEQHKKFILYLMGIVTVVGFYFTFTSALNH
jgi:hypothetical protein